MHTIKRRANYLIEQKLGVYLKVGDEKRNRATIRVAMPKNV